MYLLYGMWYKLVVVCKLILISFHHTFYRHVFGKPWIFWEKPWTEYYSKKIWCTDIRLCYVLSYNRSLFIFKSGVMEIQKN